MTTTNVLSSIPQIPECVDVSPLDVVVQDLQEQQMPARDGDDLRQKRLLLGVDLYWRSMKNAIQPNVNGFFPSAIDQESDD